MLRTPLKLIAFSTILAGSVPYSTWARDVVVTIPRRSELTPVQRLNREGVEAIKRRQYEKAETLFYKAYLYDPSDPFTLNNLGYVAELQGQLDRAHKFYQLASEQGSTASIDLSNVKQLQGKPMTSAFNSLQNGPMQVNRVNIDAMMLLSESRGFEAAALLQHALSLDPRNPFTLNNLGVASEAIGDYQGALKYYNEAADLHSSEAAVVTANRSWRGKSVSVMAAESAKRLTRAQKDNLAGAQAAMFNLRGVYAANQNDWATAKEDFLHAYSLNPGSAFSLNNRGYVAEMDGDLETAEFFYEKARKAPDANANVGLATQHLAEGNSLSTVATDSDGKVDGKLVNYSQQRRGQAGPIELTPRGPGSSTAIPEISSPQNAPSAAPSSPTPQPFQ